MNTTDSTLSLGSRAAFASSRAVFSPLRSRARFGALVRTPLRSASTSFRADFFPRPRLIDQLQTPLTRFRD
jgi:hypothetical protein